MWIPAILTLAIPTSIVWMLLKWGAIIEWWKSPWIGSFVIAITLVAAGMALMDRKLTATEKVIYFFVLGALALLEFRSLKISDDRSKDAQKKLNESFESLLADAKDTIANMTGGDSFAYVELDAAARPIFPKLRAEGRYMLKQVQLRIVDTDNDRKLRHYSGDLSVSEWLAAAFKTIVEFPQVSPNSPIMLNDSVGIDTNPATDKSYTFVIGATNGTWQEDLRLRKINGRWEHAIRVLEIEDKKPESAWQERKFDVSPGFPRLGVGGAPDWGN
jgi:hypothetical protein